MTFDERARRTITNLEKEFNIKTQYRKELYCQKFTIGIEIEVKFKYYFPDLYKQYFEGGKWKTLPYEDQCLINKEIDIFEESTLNKLQKTIECGIPKGKDKYWEFAFNPVNDLSLLIKQIDILKAIDLIPPGRHSLHITIGGPSWYSVKETRPLTFYALMILELLFSDRERVADGFGPDKVSNATWAKKGMGGILEKNEYELEDNIVGFEFRSLILKDDTNLEDLFGMLIFIMTDPRGIKLIEEIKKRMLLIGLPDVNWKRPAIKPEIWNLYIEKFDELSSELKSLFKC